MCLSVVLAPEFRGWSYECSKNMVERLLDLWAAPSPGRLCARHHSDLLLCKMRIIILFCPSLLGNGGTFPQGTQEIKWK